MNCSLCKSDKNDIWDSCGCGYNICEGCEYYLNSKLIWYHKNCRKCFLCIIQQETVMKELMYWLDYRFYHSKTGQRYSHWGNWKYE